MSAPNASAAIVILPAVESYTSHRAMPNKTRPTNVRNPTAHHLRFRKYSNCRINQYRTPARIVIAPKIAFSTRMLSEIGSTKRPMKITPAINHRKANLITALRIRVHKDGGRIKYYSISCMKYFSCVNPLVPTQRPTLGSHYASQ